MPSEHPVECGSYVTGVERDKQEDRKVLYNKNLNTNEAPYNRL